MSAELSAKRWRWVRVRLGLVATVMALCFVAMLYKAFQVQIRQGAALRARGQKQYLKHMKLTAPRGPIVDRHGVELAVTIEVDSVYANPKQVRRVTRTARVLARVLSMDARALESQLGKDRYFVWIKRKVTRAESEQIRAAELSGVELVPEPRRFYPGRDMAGPVLGFAGMDGVGLEGLELGLDEYLRGSPMLLPALRDARGRLLLADGRGHANPAGAKITLTLDRFIQFAAERALRRAVEENEAKAGVVVVMDPHTGKLLAVASFPTYDPNEPHKSPGARNRAVTDAFEPGSVMKMFSVGAAIESGVITPDTRIDVEKGRLRIGRALIRDVHHHGDLLRVSQVLKYSSNVGAVKIVRKLGKEKLHEFLTKLGFGQKTKVRLPGERSGLVRPAEHWGESGLATLSYGYGMTATPLQVATALSVMASGGMLHKPAIVERVDSADGKLIYAHRVQGRRVVKADTTRKITAMLKTVFEKDGTADHLDLGGFSAAGKTGTARKVDPLTRRYTSERHLSSFVGYMPADEPRVAIVVMIDEPTGKLHSGGEVAGPVFATLGPQIMKYLGVPGDHANGQQVSSAQPPLVARGKASDDVAPRDDLKDEQPLAPGDAVVVIPDFSGMSMAKVIEQAHQAGVTISLAGSGRAIDQFPGPGRTAQSITCHVTFDPG